MRRVLTMAMVLAALALVAPMPALAQSAPNARRVEGKVTKVVDGDTIEVRVRKQVIVVRLKGIDCPESKSNAKCQASDDCDPEAGKRATAAMRKLVGGKVVTLVSAGSDFEKDVYGRTLAYVELDDEDVGLKLISDGFCWDYSAKYPHPRQLRYRAADHTTRPSGGQRMKAPPPTPNTPPRQTKTCCKTCRKGCACGNSCISCGKTCHKASGCACNE